MPPMLRLIAILLVLSLAAVPSGAADGFVEGFEDLPLAPGLASLPDAGTTFDKPTGRIVVAYAQGATRRAEVERFYTSTLPQLGWKPEDKPNSFAREGERLVIELLGSDGALTVRYTLSPAP